MSTPIAGAFHTPDTVDIYLIGGTDPSLKDFNFLLCILENYLYFLKPVQQVCPPNTYLSIMNLYKFGNCVCKWVVRCLTTNRCMCGCVITGFTFVSAHFLKQPSSHPYFPATFLPPSAHRHRCLTASCVSCICSRAPEEANFSGPPWTPVHHHTPHQGKGNNVISSPVLGGDCLLCL